ncbi:MAG: F0F1 ATP synthase subunit delta [Dysgonamonadaceae bacterium]|jgi:F-type H+-transporting ATPase subunit delta|nr:F0F1 ATP synthase subunit delta [Dysgonamonadaceae bacterium]
MDSSRISIRYARAAYEFALERGEETRLYEDMKMLSKHFFYFRSMSRVMENPTISSKEKEKILITAGGASPSESYKKLIELIIENKREKYGLFIALMYQNWYRKQKGVVITKLITTEGVPEEVKQKIIRLVAEETKENVDLETVTDPDIIGGFILELEDKRLDAGIRHQLNQLKQQLII